MHWRHCRPERARLAQGVHFSPRLIGDIFFNVVERRRAEKEARALSRRLLTAHEDERRRLARELHDDLSQRLARLAIDAARVEPYLEGSSEEGLAQSMREDAVRMSDDVHALSYRLHPSVLDDLGLGEALRAECDLFSRRESIRVELPHRRSPLGAAVQCGALPFPRRPGGASQRGAPRSGEWGGLSLAETEGGVRMTVKDDGVGFDPVENSDTTEPRPCEHAGKDTSRSWNTRYQKRSRPKERRPCLGAVQRRLVITRKRVSKKW